MADERLWVIENVVTPSTDWYYFQVVLFVITGVVMILTRDSMTFATAKSLWMGKYSFFYGNINRPACPYFFWVFLKLPLVIDISSVFMLRVPLFSQRYLFWIICAGNCILPIRPINLFFLRENFLFIGALIFCLMILIALLADTSKAVLTGRVFRKVAKRFNGLALWAPFQAAFKKNLLVCHSSLQNKMPLATWVKHGTKGKIDCITLFRLLDPIEIFIRLYHAGTVNYG
jgi:hypothetical protein